MIMMMMIMMMPRPHQVFLLDNFAIQLLVWDPDPGTSIILRFTDSVCKRRAISLAFFYE